MPIHEFVPYKFINEKRIFTEYYINYFQLYGGSQRDKLDIYDSEHSNILLCSTFLTISKTSTSNQVTQISFAAFNEHLYRYSAQ